MRRRALRNFGLPLLVVGASVVLMASFGLTACSGGETAKPKAGKADPLPLTEYHDTTVLDMHDGSRLAWRLTTTRLVRWPGTELVQAHPVDLSVYDSSGVSAMRVTADSGSVDEAATFLLARGHVHGISAKGMNLFTDSLRWSKPLNQVMTEADVRVISESGDTLIGRGFISDANLDHWQILSGVRGVFRDVPRTVPAASPVPAGKP